MSLDSLFAEAADLDYIFDLKQTPRGWDILLWDGPIGYSRYVTTTYHETPHACIRAALEAAALGLWKELENSRPTCAPLGNLDALLSNLLTPQTASLSPPKFKLKL